MASYASTSRREIRAAPLGRGRHLVVEHLEAQALRPADFLGGGRQTHFEGSDPTEHGIEAAVIADGPVRTGDELAERMEA